VHNVQPCMQLYIKLQLHYDITSRAAFFPGCQRTWAISSQHSALSPHPGPLLKERGPRRYRGETYTLAFEPYSTNTMLSLLFPKIVRRCPDGWHVVTDTGGQNPDIPDRFGQTLPNGQGLKIQIQKSESSH